MNQNRRILCGYLLSFVWIYIVRIYTLKLEFLDYMANLSYRCNFLEICQTVSKEAALFYIPTDNV